MAEMKEAFLPLPHCFWTQREVDERQVDALLYIMGYQAEDIFCTFQLIEAEAKKFGIVMSHFDAYFMLRRNVIFE